jgi:hypothetical protein
MEQNQPAATKAVVHVSGSHLRLCWHGQQLVPCIVLRPGGEERDKVAYIVNQIKFDGPTEMIFSAKPRTKPHDSKDACGPSINPDGTIPSPTQGFVGTLPGFDEAVLVYIQADEEHIRVQPREGDEFVKFDEFRSLLKAQKLAVPLIEPMKFDAC